MAAAQAELQKLLQLPELDVIFVGQKQAEGPASRKAAKREPPPAEKTAQATAPKKAKKEITINPSFGNDTDNDSDSAKSSGASDDEAPKPISSNSKARPDGRPFTDAVEEICAFVFIRDGS